MGETIHTLPQVYHIKSFLRHQPPPPLIDYTMHLDVHASETCYHIHELSKTGLHQCNKTYINGSTPLLELHLCKTQFQVKMAVKMMTLYQRKLKPGWQGVTITSDLTWLVHITNISVQRPRGSSVSCNAHFGWDSGQTLNYLLFAPLE